MFVVPWWFCDLHDSVWVGCRRCSEHWVGTQLNIGSVSLSNTKRLLTDCLHSFMRRVGFTNVFIFYVFFCLFGIRSYLPTHTRWIWTLSWLQTQQHRCAVFCKTISKQSTRVCGGKEQVVVSIGHLHLLQNSHWNVWEYVNFKKCSCWVNLKRNAGNLTIILLFSLCWVH